LLGGLRLQSLIAGQFARVYNFFFPSFKAFIRTNFEIKRAYIWFHSKNPLYLKLYGKYRKNGKLITEFA
jgi:hypothetical protein